ncbi:coproporphyrinogen III oxidase [Campylobacter hyointestinalis subsp. hyointestinalis]|uniref:Heme chaperone HemW n=1 Tax=Campylobacter hyointestinalis subsp. hyointestinalis TaxID=91352 RepID=A0A0S4RKD4_CAMHY|nr:radical SAM family heme chaperone HemW [Campylobacter hyointestinalis]PPB53777.1 coproporphyrinogen III oxidase [Campylobacter hyointestinalis subsp. hyointestinalis]PPB60586.1 coproporphyrinogen III oxidase [Campylobacter hyointestinalis subsp. hyointestinalis]PPB62977.1 coproporphyrinogen III oxidase [Campylobacter hyointestinalis subsp. hyointestinalis]CUU69133.1 coproporphyrinogen III oxidase [Campylobacter hyointestinalis subsp. hyointestinalis]CUU73651.1 coproporphyrinogen III oxidase
MQIYIHIPFCESKCPYCAFGSHSDKFSQVKKYFLALNHEIQNTILDLNEKITTIFIGGGTPSSVNAEFYAQIFEVLKPKLAKNAEITSEANPNSANLQWLEDMKSLGVNRISFGAQSFDEKKLRLLGRIHSKNAIFKAVQNAKIAKFKNINVDLMYSTKLDTKKLLKRELENIANLGISHISAYSLSLEEKTPFWDKLNLKKDSLSLARYLISGLEDIGFKQYEISNFGKICTHNLGYWKQKDYLGFGAYAVGTMGDRRFYSPSDLDEYIANPLQKKVEILSKKDMLEEHIFLGLRSCVGIKLSNLDKEKIEKVELLEKENKIYIKNGRAFNTNFLIADEISLFLT